MGQARKIRCETGLHGQHGFTLIELVVVIIVIGILAAVAVPRYFDMQETTAEMTNEANARGIRAAILLHYVNELMENPGYTLTDAVDDYHAAPENFFYDGQVPHTAEGGDFNVSINGDFLIVTY